MTLVDLIRFGLEALEADRLGDAEECFAKALQASCTDEDRQEVLRCLLKLAGKYMRLGTNNKPQALFEYLERTDLQERTRVLEWLARLHHQMQDLAGAARIYTDIFEERARTLGAEHPDTVGALKTAALLLQMQGKSAEELYVKAFQVSKISTGNKVATAEPIQKHSSNPAANLPAEAPQTKSSSSAATRSEAVLKSSVQNLQSNGNLDKSPEQETAQARKRPTRKTDTLFLLDALISHDRPESEDLAPPEEIPEFLTPPLTLEANLEELVSAWEPFCNQITHKLVKLLQQNSNLAYRNTLAKLSSLLSESKGVKPVDFDHPFLASSRRPECNYLDWNILKELAPVYAAYDGTSKTYPMEISTIYACLRRAFELGPLHVDTLQSLYRLSHIYAQELFGCYDIDFAAAGFRICLLAFRDHPEITDLTRIRCRSHLAGVLMAKEELKQAKEILKEAVQLADSVSEISRAELISMLRTLADCTNRIGDYETATSVYERLRNFQEAVSRDIELFETFIQLICNYRKAGNDAQVQSYQQRLIWELDWLKDANPVRESIASKALELELSELAELMLHEIIRHSTPYDPISARAMQGLIKIYEASGRDQMAGQLKAALGG